MAGMNLAVLSGVGIAFVVIAIVVSFGATILGDLQETTVSGATGCNATVKTACGVDYNATVYGLNAVDTMSDWLPTIALVVIAAIIIGVLVSYLAGRGNQ